MKRKKTMRMKSSQPSPRMIATVKAQAVTMTMKTALALNSIAKRICQKRVYLGKKWRNKLKKKIEEQL